MKFIKNLLKIFIFLLFIIFGVIGVLTVYLYFTTPVGTLPEDYIIESARKTVIKAVLDEKSLSPIQQQLLEDGNYEELAKDYEENITDEQIDCAVNAVGEKRAKELLKTQDPTPAELLKLSKCL